MVLKLPVHRPTGGYGRFPDTSVVRVRCIGSVPHCGQAEITILAGIVPGSGDDSPGGSVPLVSSDDKRSRGSDACTKEY